MSHELQTIFMTLQIIPIVQACTTDDLIESIQFIMVPTTMAIPKVNLQMLRIN